MWWITLAAISNPEEVVWTVVKITLIGTIAGWLLSAVGAGNGAKFVKIACTIGALYLVALQVLDLYHKLKAMG